MTALQLLWAALGLSLVGFIMLWYGAAFQEGFLWVGLVVFALGMLLGPLSRFVATDE